MSYVENVLRRRQEAKEAWRPRYNPLEDVGEQLMAIDEAMYERAKSEEEKKRAAERYGLEKEKYGLEKERIVAETKKLQTDRTASEEALAAQRRAWEAAAKAREEELRARTAAQRDEARAAEQERARKAVIEKGFGMMRGAGLPGPGATPVSKADLDELGATVGMTGDEVLAGIEEIEAERAKMGAGLGLVEAKKETEQERAAALRRKGVRGPPSAAQQAKIADETYLRTLKKKYEELKIKEKQLKLAQESGFTMTPDVLSGTQKARIAARNAQSSMNALRRLLNKYPNIEEYVGPLDNMGAWVAQKFGAQGKEQAEIRSTIDQVFSAFKLIQTGAAAGEKEMIYLQGIMPSTTDSLPAILGKMQANDNLVNESVAYYDKLLATKDIRSGDELAGGAGIPAPAAPKKAPSKAVQSDIDEFGLED